VNGKIDAHLMGSLAMLLQKIASYPINYISFDDKQHRFNVDLGDSGVVSIKIYNEFLSVTVDLVMIMPSMIASV